MRRRGRVALFGAALALVAVLVLARFPYARLLPPLLAAAHTATGAQITVADLGLGLGLGGPRVVARDVSLRWPGASPLSFEALRLRPAWSPAWLAGKPRWHVEAEGALGAFRGIVAPDRASGAWRDLAVDALPWALLGSAAPLHGRLSGSLDLSRDAGAWLGSAALIGKSGSIDLPGLPVAIPFEALAAELVVGASEIQLTEGRIEGPLVTAQVRGKASADGGDYASWPLDLDVEIEAVDPALRGYFAPMGIQVTPDGRGRLRVTGSLGAPYLTGPGS